MIKVIKLHTIIVFTIILSLLLPSAIVKSDNVEQMKPNIIDGYNVISQSNNLVLYCNREKAAIAVEDKRTGYVWRSLVDKEELNLDDKNAQLVEYLASMITVSYFNAAQKDINITKLYSASKTTNIKIIEYKDGLSLNFNFTRVGISVALDITLDQDMLIIKIPVEKIVQSMDKEIVSIELMPFFGASDNSGDGYIFYPDGSGAILRYDKGNQRSERLEYMSWYIYGQEEVSIKNVYQSDMDGKYQALLPVYGIKNGSSAVLFAATEGEEDTRINVYPSGYVLDLNRAGFEFNYRHFYKASLSNITIKGRNTAKLLETTRADPEMIERDREARIFFLADSEANYSGMANTYREYLVNEGQINQVIQKSDSIPLSLDLFMGIKEENMLFDKFIKMTTYNDAIKIIGEMLKTGIDNMDVTLKGWTKGGYGLYPVNWPPEPSLGGINGIKSLLKYAKDNNVKLYLANNFTQADSRNGGFSNRKDVVINGSSIAIADFSKTLFLLNPMVAYNRFVNFIKALDKYDGSNIAFEDIGDYIYHDYNKKNPSSRSNTIATWSGMLEAAGKAGKSVAVEGGNKYVLKNSTRLYDIPIDSSNYHSSDETIPFYQMVVHGMLPYTSKAGNLSHNLDELKLKWVEYGCMPYFELTSERSIKLRNTEYNRLFTSHYGDWIKQAEDIYKEFNQRLKPVWSQRMVLHERVSEKLYRVVYSNYTTVYINYADHDAIVDGYKIGALDYLVIDKGGKSR